MPSQPANITLAPSSSILIVLRPNDHSRERHVLLLEHPHSGASSLELPSGVLDTKSGYVIGTAMDKIEHETSINIRNSELIDMRGLARECGVEGRYLGSDVHVPLLLWEKTMDRREYQFFIHKVTEQQGKSGAFAVRVRSYDELLKEKARGVKTVAACALYEGLTMEGRISERMREMRTDWVH